ncbi:alpha/beta hydrolase [Nocardia otitidiscaviarum]|uniref:alpha/beta fold hydrolase n=1 Tax=Nocardia otitidiscaviarum TaxID=1823 RepID=UPI0004A6C3EB|nr:alpha/beta hydrolase [Nocardia otitidiscaviarum]MBF6134760.1 alpha/beta hydrolase [Nocardia otitidiscaviarum]MBF6485614.1 alpha/beta hydrolase [Nocardia otitidiscaviarum]
MAEPKTHTLEVPGAILTYDIRDSETGDGPVVLMIGSPMGAAGFGTLAGYFTDRTVVTYDPRGVERSTRTDDARESTPDQHADDLHRLITALDRGPVDVFASSGGAVNALALVAQHPEQVRTLVAHEPPAAQVLPDREHALAATTDVCRTYTEHGFGPAMAKFLTLSSHQGEVPADFAEWPTPDPAELGMPTEDDGSRDDVMFAQNLATLAYYEHDFDALRAAPTRIVLAGGIESEGQLARRGSEAVAQRLGTEMVVFPSNHGGFLGGEYGQTGEPEAFAAALREALEG